MLSATFLDPAGSGTDVLAGTSRTFTAQDLGTAASDREIIVATFAYKSGAGGFTSPSGISVTVAGVPASLIAETFGGSSTFALAFYRASVPAGSTGNVVVATSTFSLRQIGIALWAMYGGIDSTASASGTTNTTITGVADGVILATAGIRNGVSPDYVWTNATLDYNLRAEGNDALCSGAHATTVGSTTITATKGGSSERILAVAFTPTAVDIEISYALGSTPVTLALGANPVTGVVGAEPA